MRDPIDVLLQVVKWLDENYQDKEILSMPNPDSVNIAIRQLEAENKKLTAERDSLREIFISIRNGASTLLKEKAV